MFISHRFSQLAWWSWGAWRQRFHQRKLVMAIKTPITYSAFTDPWSSQASKEFRQRASVVCVRVGIEISHGRWRLQSCEARRCRATGRLKPTRGAANHIQLQTSVELPSHINNRRKFRSQTSDNMDKWKAEQGRGREKRKIRRKKSRRERVRRKKLQTPESW